jgi:hypothetical protein
MKVQRWHVMSFSNVKSTNIKDAVGRKERVPFDC